MANRWKQENQAYEVDEIAPQQTRGSVGGYPPRPTSGGYPPRPTSGGYPPRPTSGGYPPRPTSGGYPPRSTSGSYPPRSTSDSYPPRPTSGSYPPQGTPGDYPPQPTPGGYPPQQAPAGYSYPAQPNAYPLVQPAAGAFPTQQNVVQPPQAQHQQSSVSNTTVIIQQPAAQTEVVLRNQTWSSDLFDCCDDCGLCFLGVCCPSCLAGHVASKAGEWYCVGTSCPVALRSSIRTRYNIQGSVLRDACVMSCCPLCAYCQMGRELKTRNGR